MSFRSLNILMAQIAKVSMLFSFAKHWPLIFLAPMGCAMNSYCVLWWLAGKYLIIDHSLQGQMTKDFWNDATYFRHELITIYRLHQALVLRAKSHTGHHGRRRRRRQRWRRELERRRLRLPRRRRLGAREQRGMVVDRAPARAHLDGDVDVPLLGLVGLQLGEPPKVFPFIQPHPPYLPLKDGDIASDYLITE